jgi:hypothetical protein
MPPLSAYSSSLPVGIEGNAQPPGMSRIHQLPRIKARSAVVPMASSTVQPTPDQRRRASSRGVTAVARQSLWWLLSCRAAAAVRHSALPSHVLLSDPLQRHHRLKVPRVPTLPPSLEPLPMHRTRPPEFPERSRRHGSLPIVGERSVASPRRRAIRTIDLDQVATSLRRGGKAVRLRFFV